VEFEALHAQLDENTRRFFGIAMGSDGKEMVS
jgi:hypothetical protein